MRSAIPINNNFRAHNTPYQSTLSILQVLQHHRLNGFRAIQSIQGKGTQAFIIALLLSLFPLISVAELKLTIDPLEISIEEDFELTISSNSATSGNIDISPLQQDFEILDQYKQSRVQIINGNMSQSTTWTYTLVAKRSGKITIPAITVGNDKTKARDITVKKESIQGSHNQDVIVEAEIEQSSAYVQGQFIYVQRLLFAKSFRSNSTLTAPNLATDLAEVVPLANTPERIVKRNGRDYRMLTRRFAITPQKSGKLVIAPTVFSGTMRRSSQQYSNRFGFNPRSRRIRVRSNAVSIEIKPRPTEFTGKDWIVAKDFSLHLSWSSPPDQIKAGDPVTVVLAAIANGFRAEQLPNIKLQAPSGIKLYPEKPSFNNERNLEGIIGTMNQNIVLVATGGGEFELPEISIPWWNSETHQQEIAKLKAVKLIVSGTPIPTTPIANQKIISKPELEIQGKQESAKKEEKLSTTIIIILTLIILLLLTGLAWFFVRWKNKQKIKNNKYSPASQQNILNALEQACLNNNPTKAQNYLQQWKSSIQPSPTLDIEQKNSPLQQQINQLHHALYAKEKTNWKGDNLWQAVQIYQTQLKKLKHKNNDKKGQDLEPLYF